MYPLIRFARTMAAARHAPKLRPFDTHVSTVRIWPWDIDPWMELNNGRTLTIYDLGRIPMAVRLGVVKALRAHGYGFTVAGSNVRYRRRITAFQKVTMLSRTIGWDDRFIYMEQSLWSKGECCNQMLLRAAVVSLKGRRGMIAPAQVMQDIGADATSPELPEWVRAWILSESERPWPPALVGIAPGDLTADLPG